MKLQLPAKQVPLYTPGHNSPTVLNFRTLSCTVLGCLLVRIRYADALINPTRWQIFKVLHSAVFCNTQVNGFLFTQKNAQMQASPVATTVAVIITAALHFVCTKQVITVMLAEPFLLQQLPQHVPPNGQFGEKFSYLISRCIHLLHTKSYPCHTYTKNDIKCLTP